MFSCPHAPPAGAPVRRGDRRRAGAAEDDLHFVDFLAGELERVQEPRAADDRGPVLVVVKHGDIHDLFEPLLDVEALGRLDVFQVDPAEGGFHIFDRLDDLVRIVRVELDIEHVDIGKPFKEDSLPFHDGLAGESPDVAQTQHRRPVAHDCDKISFGGIEVGVVRVCMNLHAGLGHAGCVGKREIALRRAGLRGDYFDLSPPALRVIIERFLFSCHFVAVSCSGAIASEKSIMRSRAIPGRGTP
jgi:hypothetical protein